MYTSIPSSWKGNLKRHLFILTTEGEHPLTTEGPSSPRGHENLIVTDEGRGRNPGVGEGCRSGEGTENPGWWSGAELGPQAFLQAQTTYQVCATIYQPRKGVAYEPRRIILHNQ